MCKRYRLKLRAYIDILGEDSVLVSSESVQCSSFPGVTLDEPVVQLDALLRRKGLSAACLEASDFCSKKRRTFSASSKAPAKSFNEALLADRFE